MSYDYVKRSRHRLKRKCVDYLGNRCTDCKVSYNNDAVYDFHHLDPAIKDFSIGSKIRSWEILKKELDKCVLLCSNCHRVRHSDIRDFERKNRPRVQKGCLVCGIKVSHKATHCKDHCQRNTIQLPETLEEFLELIKSYPTYTALSKYFGCSDNGIKKSIQKKWGITLDIQTKAGAA